MPRQKMDNMFKATFLIPVKLHKALVYIAKRRGTTYSQLLRDIAREFVIRALQDEKLIAELEAQHEHEQPSTEPEPADDADDSESDAPGIGQ